MVRRDRARPRNVHIFKKSDRATEIGGMRTNGTTNEMFYNMIEVFLIFESEYILEAEDGARVPRDGSPVVAGKYFVDSTGRSLSMTPLHE